MQMATLNPLQQLHGLDRSSPNFHNQLSALLRGEEFQNAIPYLQTEGLAWLIECLDIDLADSSVPTNHTFQECLRGLVEICGARGILPKSCALPGPLLDADPTAATGRSREGSIDGSKVWVKRVGTYFDANPREAKKIFHQVAVLWKHSVHPNIVPLLGVSTDPFLFVSSWMPGGNLREYIIGHPDADRLGLLSDVAEGLNYLHSCNVIHGDLKGSNILIDAIGRARITDFGLATVTKKPGSIRSPYGSHTVRWTAPEILNGQGSYCKETDVFSFAMVTIEAFTTTIPFNEDLSDMIALAIIGGKRPPRPTHSNLTDWLWELTRLSWDPDSSLRPQISQALEVLHRFGRSAWNRLITSSPTTPERTSLIEAIFSDPDEVEAVGDLCGNDAQTFIDAVHEALDDPALPFRKRCINASRKICGKQSLLPNSLQIPLCYNPLDNALYSGGYADVWKGQYQGYSVAVKILRVYSTSDFDKIKNRFCKEVMTWKTLRHPNVLPLLGATMTNNKFAMTSKWMENGNINEFIEKDVTVDRFKLLRDVSNGLIYLHGQTMIHGDLKGANILIDEYGSARLADFGLLTFVSDPANPTASSSYTPGGTTRWMSPELLHPDQFGCKDGRPTKESDCYALGMVIYEVLSGKLPFASYMGTAIMLMVINGERPERPQGEAGGRFTDYLWHTLQLCWAQEQKRRPTIEEVLECLGPVPEGRKPSSTGCGVNDPPQAHPPSSLTLSPLAPATLSLTSRKRRRSGSESEILSGRDLPRAPGMLVRSVAPEASVVNDLVNLFFEYCYPARMMIHKPTFMASLSQDKVASHLVFAMCAVSAPFMQSSHVESRPPQLAGIKFYEDALDILFDSSGRLICEENLQTVQTLCLLEMHDVAQYSWTKHYRFLDIATNILFGTLNIASPESPNSWRQTLQEITHMRERECARRCYWIIYFLRVLGTACTRNVSWSSAENTLLRLPVGETSFELGFRPQTPEYLDRMALEGCFASEFGHLIRITVLFLQMEDAVAIVDDDDRFASAVEEAETALKAWESSLPGHLQYTGRNFHIMSSNHETPTNSDAWCFFYIHALRSCCEMSALLEIQKRFRSDQFAVPGRDSDAPDRCLRILKSAGSWMKNSNYIVIPSLCVLSRYFKDNSAIISVDREFETVWGWRVCDISETWRKHNGTRELQGGWSQNRTTTGGSSNQTVGRHLGGLKIRGPALKISPPSPTVPADYLDNSLHRPSLPAASWFLDDPDGRTLASLKAVGLLDPLENRWTNMKPTSRPPPRSQARE